MVHPVFTADLESSVIQFRHAGKPREESRGTAGERRRRDTAPPRGRRDIHLLLIMWLYLNISCLGFFFYEEAASKLLTAATVWIRLDRRLQLCCGGTASAMASPESDLHS